MIQICPKCGMPYDTAPALSREDNSTKICPDCGTWEALEDMEIEMEEKIGILSEVHRPLKDRSSVQFPKADMVQLVRDIYPIGCRVWLIYMNDQQAPPIGTCGTVTGVDDVATIHVRWDSGSSLGIAYGEDCCRLVCCNKETEDI